MDALLIAVLAGAALLIAYFTYGRWVAGRVFRLREDAATPATSLCDDQDYCPTPKTIVFGHHFTSIAGTGPIVGPAIAVMWGWLPAILWVIFGSIFIGAVHDLGALVVSLRNKGRSVGDIAGDLLGPRVRIIFLGVLILALWIVLAIFGLVIAAVLRQYPGAIFPVLVQIPLAILIGLTVHRKGRSIVLPSLIALGLMYASVVWGDWGPLHTFNTFLAAQPTWLWVSGLLAYAYVASVMPVWVLLQPRDYINALQLITALALLVVGLVVAATLGGDPGEFAKAEQTASIRAPSASEGSRASINNAIVAGASFSDAPAGAPSAGSFRDPGATEGSQPSPSTGTDAGLRATDPAAQRAGGAPDPSPQPPPSGRGSEERPELRIVAPMVNWQPEGAPPLMPVLFITIACGAVSGFHCLVGSGTTSKQLSKETDARAVGYGSMLTEAFLATLVILACTAGIGLGITKAFDSDGRGMAVHDTAGPIAFQEYHATVPAGDELEYKIYGMRFWPGEPEVPSDEPADGASMAFTPEDIGAPRGFGIHGQTFLLEYERAGRQEWTYPFPTPVTQREPLENGEILIDPAAGTYTLRGEPAYLKQYESWGAAGSLGAKVGAFVDGSANFVRSLGISAGVAVALMGVLVASFAGTTMDTACRLQRYVIQELARTFLPRPPSPSCHRCGYDLRGHLPSPSGRGVGGEGVPSEPSPLGRGQGEEDSAGAHESDDADEHDDAHAQSPSPYPSPKGRGESESIQCPECGAVNRWHLETRSHPDERDPATVGWDAVERHASAMNPAKWLATKHGATVFAVVTAALLAAIPAPGQSWTFANAGQGGLILWPLFGATNQLLGGLAFLVLGAWLIATKRPWWFMSAPAVFMLVVPAWALVWQGFIGNEANPSWLSRENWLLVAIAAITVALEAWLVLEVTLRARLANKGAVAIDPLRVR